MASVLLAAGLLVGSACDSRSASDRDERAGGVVRAPNRSAQSTTTTALPPSGTPLACPEARPADDPGVRGLTDLEMVSPKKGYAVGQDVILVTDDGRDWRRRYDETAWFLSVDVLDARHAWAVAQHRLLATVDGGKHWLPAAEPVGASLRTVEFVDPSSGWGSDGRHVYRTVDGGHSWAPSDPPCGAERICFAGSDGWAARDRHVFRMGDSGQWTSVFTLPVANGDNQFNARSVHIDAVECAAGGVVWITFAGRAPAGPERPYVVYRGTATGSWSPVLTSPGGPLPAGAAPVGGAYPAPLSAVDADNAVFASFTPEATPSTAVTVAGRTGPVAGAWHPIPTVYSVTSLSFPTPTTGWTLATRAGASNVDAVLATTDGGRTWHEQFSRPVPPPGT